MKIRIYQINMERDAGRVVFESLERLEKHCGTAEVNSSLYDKVFDGNVECNDLEEVFRMFNLNHPEGYTGRSLSVSDIVEVVDAGISNYYFCDSIGFQEVAFASERTVDTLSLKKPEWGIYPEGFIPPLYWGARAIITDGFVDLLPDRQSFQRAAHITDDEKDEFTAWLDKQAIPYLNQRVNKCDTAHIEFVSRDKRFRIVAEDRDSGGYLYIGAYRC